MPGLILPGRPSPALRVTNSIDFLQKKKDEIWRYAVFYFESKLNQRAPLGE